METTANAKNVITCALQAKSRPLLASEEWQNICDRWLHASRCHRLLEWKWSSLDLPLGPKPLMKTMKKIHRHRGENGRGCSTSTWQQRPYTMQPVVYLIRSDLDLIIFCDYLSAYEIGSHRILQDVGLRPMVTTTCSAALQASSSPTDTQQQRLQFRCKCISRRYDFSSPRLQSSRMSTCTLVMYYRMEASKDLSLIICVD